MRASTLLLSCSLLVLACADTEPGGDRAARFVARADEPAADATEPEVAPGPGPGPSSAPQTMASGEPPPAVVDAEAPAEAGESVVPEEAPAGPEAPAEPGDPLAPIPPSGPEPGSPEADAELAELLEESTLTQEEFDAAFRSNKPKISGDQLVFGPGERTRKRPVVKVGTLAVSGSKLAASELSTLAKAHLRGFEGCLAVALSEDPKIAASVTLIVPFDGKGEAGGSRLEGGAGLGDALRECLIAVADNWSLAGAAGASVRVPLTLGSE